MRYREGVTSSAKRTLRSSSTTGPSPKSASNGEDGPRNRIWLFVILFLLGCVVLVLRRPEAVLLPQFFAEDGAVFFRDAFHLPFYRSWLLPHAGYQNLLPRLLAEGAFIVPLRYVPAFYNLSALIVAALSLCWIALPNFRSLIPSDWMRAGLVVLFWVMPNQEALMKLSYLQWYVLLWMALVSMMRLPGSARGRSVLALACGIGFLSAPVAAITLPVWALRVWAARDRGERRFSGALLLAGTVVLIANLATPYSGPVPLPDWPMPLLRAAHGMLNGISYKVVCSMGGAHLAAWLATLGWWAIHLVCAVVVGGLTVGFRRLSGKDRLLGAILLWLIVASVACFVLRPHFLEDFAIGRNLYLHDRYFFLAISLTYVAVFVALSRLPVMGRTAGQKQWIGTLLLLLVIALQMPALRYRWTPTDHHWPEVAEGLPRLQQEVDRTGVPRRAIIPINPDGWRIDLELRPGSGTTDEAAMRYGTH